MPSSVGITKAVSAAQQASSKLSAHLSQVGHPILDQLNQSLAQAQAETFLYETKANKAIQEQFDARQVAEKAAEYEHGKRMKALKELWFWRVLALTISGIVLAGVGIKTGWKFFLK
jgi:hypothetical protein